MKIEVFKKLIKEAVREVIREELSTLTEGTLVTRKEPSTKNLANIVENPASFDTQKANGISPILEQMLMQTRKELTSADVKNILGETSVISEVLNNTPAVDTSYGIDLSALPFTKKAKQIYDRSLQPR